MGSNAMTLEFATSQNPHCGTLLTFAQFLLVALTGIRKQLVINHGPAKRRPTTHEAIVARVVQDVLERQHGKLPAKGHLENVPIGVAFTGSSEWTKKLRDDVATKLEESHGKQVLDMLRKEGAGGIALVVANDVTPGSMDMVVQVVEDKKEASPEATLAVDYTDPAAPLISSDSRSRRSLLPRIRFKRPRIPIRVWLIQVTLFFVTSLLNNLALGYNVNLAVHIIFRSGGLSANLLLGWLAGKRYSRMQVASVILVTFGVMAATLSVKAGGKGDYRTQSASAGSYAIGILLLTIALLLSAGMGLAQERAYNKYGRHWEEGLFYLHFLSLPMFGFVGKDLLTQFKMANASPRVEIRAASLVTGGYYFVPGSPLVSPVPAPFGNRILGMWMMNQIERWIIWWDMFVPALSIPSFWIPVMLNVATQWICVSGVHRLTSRVSSLTVTLVLVIRKAVSLGISVVVIQGSSGNVWLWGGAAAVLLGTILYSMDGQRRKEK
ncbi:golgi uridine diphosphate-N- acetylglucosamine transporter [Tulasnella sp. 403]|nr:golgi uridine diphosphate-N- acetylglucosamine transporter [Tulasnella sp. 403]